MIQENVPTILQEFVQPRVINQDMLINLVIEQGPKGEAGKLFYEDGINLHETRKIRIEFLSMYIVLYLRKFKKLRSLNINGNPCTKEDGYLDYVFAFIPQLIYYEYKMITNEQRKNAREKHYRTLNTLEEIEMKEKEELDAQEEYKKKLAFLTAAYVEYLDDDYLFHQMFEDDKEGKDLSMVNEDTQNAFEEYKINFSALCKEFCEIGLEEHDKRINETNLYDIAVKEGKSISENQGRMIVNEVLHKKTDISATIKQLIKKLTGNVDAITLENITKEAHQLSEEFNDIITDAWTKLMSIEVDLHEQMEDINEVFRINMSDMMDSFLTIARGYFSQLRNCEAEYNDTINGLILYYLSGFGDDVKLPRHLLNLCEDKDMLNYNLNNSHERHLQIIDAREDTMINRAKNWLEEYNEQLIKYERERNNQQVLEISHFADFQQQEFSQLLQQLNLNTDDSEVILALDE
ncbi:dynein regulatory complex subunit 3-like isoform X3 [Frieseomelitta varia]|uniref:dynein regulatory complex subunit 3-like isoform X3 n=1 Tax=Frieseomelitta varia TaxID=561572 RepID=UPI001CB68C74|nr:dynein regulatory complex subunit 3-like isoform X3 [Frieseomelitta varia]